MSRIKDYTKINWSELVYYDESSPSSLRWKIDRFNCSKTLKAAKGSIAGSLSAYKYWVIPSNGTLYKVHRIIWILLNNTLEPTEQIDHIDRDRSNNKIGNLRKVSSILNRRNISKQQNNTSGITGVRWETRFGCTYVIAQWNEAGTKRIKRFSVKKHGLLPAFAEAVKYRQAMIEELNAKGYGYSENHGK